MSIRRQHPGTVPGAADSGALDQAPAPRRGTAMAAVAVAVLSLGAILALSTPIRDAASTTLVAPARADDRAVAPGQRVSDTPRTPAVEGNSDSLVIREAHSDGGYWYSLEQQPAGGSGGH